MEEAEDHSDGVVVVYLKTVVDVFSHSLHVGGDHRVPNALCRTFSHCYDTSSVYTESREAQGPGMRAVMTEFQNARCNGTHPATARTAHRVAYLVSTHPATARNAHTYSA